jgi:murein DD-endopeptidase MepM/ murein hydrolase activator NlpD
VRRGDRPKLLIIFLGSTLLCLFGLFSGEKANPQSIPPSLDSSCPPPVLSRLQRHQVAPGETLNSIAQRYNLLPNTLISLNPALKGGRAPAGSKILIPPFNGIRVQAPKGATWQDLSKAYGVRADLLFELNGCKKFPEVVFVPGVNWQGKKVRDNYTGLTGYPLPAKAAIAVGYGWQTRPDRPGSFFHSGIDLLAAPNTPVLAADRGTVVYAGQEGTYGYLVVVDHGNDLQTRYAHLSRLNIKIGQAVATGDILGFVGVTGKPDTSQPHLHFEVRYRLPVGWVAQDPMVHLANIPPK